jgi:uncharacterized protein YxjI
VTDTSQSTNASEIPAGTFVVKKHLGTFESYRVSDANGNQIYHFKGELAIAKQKWAMLDASGAKVAELVHPKLHVHPTFTLDLPGQPEIIIRKADFNQVNENWRVEGSQFGDLDITGNISDHEFTLIDSTGTTVATASRKWVSMTGAYGVEVNGIDPILALAAVVGIDATEHSNQQGVL